VIHDGTSQTGENDDPVEDKENIVPAKGIGASGWVKVRNAKELLSVVLRRGED